MSLRAVVTVLQFRAPGLPVGDIPLTETLPDPPEAVAKILATPETDNLRRQ